MPPYSADSITEAKIVDSGSTSDGYGTDQIVDEHIVS